VVVLNSKNLNKDVTLPQSSSTLLIDDINVSGTLDIPDSSKLVILDVDAIAYTSSTVLRSTTSELADNGFPYEGTAEITGSIIPEGDGVHNLGSNTNRWGNVFTSDLSLKNEIGDWTIVEGSEELFIYNNNSNKVFKFALIEVDPEDAPPKKS